MRYKVEVIAVDTVRKRKQITVEADNMSEAEKKALKEAFSMDRSNWEQLSYDRHDHFLETGVITRVPDIGLQHDR
jgi:hypothetical protein